MPPVYNVSKTEELGRFLRNEAVHFHQLDLDLKDLFQCSKQGLVGFCKGLIEGEGVPFSIWKGINNNHLALMKDLAQVIGMVLQFQHTKLGFGHIPCASHKSFRAAIWLINHNLSSSAI